MVMRLGQGVGFVCLCGPQETISTLDIVSSNKH